MRINLIPDELRPTRASPVPYMPIAGLLAIGLVWLITQFAAASGAEDKTADYKTELKRLSSQLIAYNNLPDRTVRAETERDSLKLKAAAVTALTHTGFPCTPVLEALGEAATDELRLTSILVDIPAGTAMLKGYGSAEKADIEAASFVRALNRSKAILATFVGAELNYCTGSRRGGADVKEFSVSLRFRGDRLQGMLVEEEAADDG